VKSLPPDVLLSVLGADQIRQYLEQHAADPPTQPRKPRRKK
jgi:hypothetical protein